MTHTRPAPADLYPVRDAAGNGVGVVERRDYTRSPWIAHVTGWHSLSHSMRETAEAFVLAHAGGAR